MNSSKPIDISKSSLISLKAELSRKQEEAQKVKQNRPADVTGNINKLKNIKSLNKRKQRKQERTDKESETEQNTVNEEDEEALKKSREILELKSKLYQHLQEGKLTAEKGKSEFLVNFEGKKLEALKEVQSVDSSDVVCISEDEDEFEDDPSSDPENDWVDFVDFLGRSRRCLRKDLSYMKERDENLSKRLKPPVPVQNESTGVSSTSGVSQELLSSDMHREMMRKKWEEQEKLLLNKSDIHYQDLLFDEARTHGVSYYSFSTNEEERLRQQQDLSKLRQETVQRQEEAKGLRLRRQQQLQARLQAARARNRQRMGLPPEEEKPEESDVALETTGVTEDEDKKSDSEEKRLHDLEDALKRATHVRPWDIGKDGVQAPQVMSQEEWVEKQRNEREPEFAPPVMYKEDIITSAPSTSKRSNPGLFFTSKKLRPSSSSDVKASTSSDFNEGRYADRVQSVPELSGEDHHLEGKGVENKDRKYAEMPPPTSMEYFIGDHSRKKYLPKSKSSDEVKDSISEGLRFLNKQSEIKEKKRDKGLLDIM